jgi:hypothetical protein
MRLLDWCGVPQYSEARLALLRYAEITRKLEEVLVEVFAACDEDEDTLDSPTEDLFNSMIDLRIDRPDRSVLSRVSSRYSSSSSSGPQTGRSFENSVCHETHPLFRGVPGRELSASETDGAAFFGDSNASIRSVPDDIARDQWTQHPLAKGLALSTKEKAFLGLILRTEISSREI